MHRGPGAFLHQVVGGRWRLLEVLCATERRASFRVETVDDGRPARLELWDQRSVEHRGELARFERESRTLSHLRHERCVSVIAFGAHEGRPFLVSDLPDGKALRDEIGKADLTVPRALSLGLQLCDGLRHLHGHGVVHRALLPENVWVSQSPVADLLKIGLPRLGHVTDTSDGTRERCYLPPERSGGRLDHRADLYAAGMLLYVMCTGREPPAEVVASTAGGAPVPPPRTVAPERGISEALERVILRALAPSSDVRFATADELVTALKSAGADSANPKRRSAQRPRKRRAMIAATFAAVAVVGAGALRSSGGHGPSASPPAAHAARAPNIPLQTAIESKAVPAAPIAASPVEPAQEAAPEAAPSRTAPIVATISGAPPHGERSEIWSLLDSGRLDEGATRIKPLVADNPESAWPRFALGILYYQRHWRRDSVKQWQLALEHDPEIRNEPQFGLYLCFMLDDAWKAAGMADLLDQLGGAAVPLLEHCSESAKTPRLRSLASRALARLRRGDHRSRQP